MVRPLLCCALLLGAFGGCGGETQTSADAGDAAGNTDGCGKCIDAPFAFDAGEAGSPEGGGCPSQPPGTWTTMCGVTSSPCHYPATTDAGADADLACLCQPHGEDILEYDCATYDECMSASGTVTASVKSCTTDNDCRAVAEQTDCCGSLLYVGIANVSSELFDACEASWASQYPACNCAASAKTEDGNPTAMNGSAASVHCVANACATSTP